MQIFIKNDRTVVVDINEDASIDRLRQIILMKYGYPQNIYYMTCNGKLIGNGKISDYKISRDSTIHIHIRLNYDPIYPN